MATKATPQEPMRERRAKFSLPPFYSPHPWERRQQLKTLHITAREQGNDTVPSTNNTKHIGCTFNLAGLHVKINEGVDTENEKQREDFR